MKYIYIFFLFACCITFIAPSPIGAADAETAPTQKEIAGVLPTSMWYWIDVLAEQVKIWRASDEERPELLRALLEEKSAEMALTIDEAKQAAQAAERYEVYFRDLAKTVDPARAEEYDAFVDYTLAQLTTLAGTIENAGQTEIPSYMQEIAVTMSDVHKTLMNEVQGDIRATAASLLLGSVDAFSNSAISAQAQGMITQFAQSIFQWIADFLQEQFSSLSAQAQAYVQAKAAEYLDSAKSSVIQYIQSIEIP